MVDRQQDKFMFYIFLIILYMWVGLYFVLLITLACSANEPTNFNYSAHGDNWANCPQNGTKQSPILLHVGQQVQKSKDSFLFGDYMETRGVANFLNTTIYINTSDSFGAVMTRLIDGVSVPFKANEIRVRMHSEHQTEDGYFDLELQIFHFELYPTSRNYRFAIALLFNVGDSQNLFLNQIIAGYQKNATAAEISVDLSSLISKNVIDDFWFYNGSPTIPTCNEGKVHWVVIRKTYSMSAEQKIKLTQILQQGRSDWDGNWRKIQAQNNNIVAIRQIQPLSSQF